VSLSQPLATQARAIQPDIFPNCRFQPFHRVRRTVLHVYMDFRRVHVEGNNGPAIVPQIEQVLVLLYLLKMFSTMFCATGR